ncbi:HAD family hydrolase [Paenibacillus nasutitermitis]|uniref:Haloacid dehalogenase n=1 Tax=Paenibacillus nasutitermitis TaxID=1652958 RepID=A0A917DUV7_9BACL|nr:HAD family hydrolase [Paenibacillus nasutitermitis]GGD73305.1 haloacid dehalogenase [Paenibacillus nasutitermitis]
MSIKAVVFDLDDTLYLEKNYTLSGFKAVGHWVKEHHGVAGFYETAASLLHEGVKGVIFNRALEQHGIPAEDKLVAELVDCYRSHRPDINLLEDAGWVLDNLDKDVKLGLISDGYLVAQEQKVRALNLANSFHSIVLTDALGRNHWKPSPLPYETASRQMGVPHYQCLYVGDNVTKDFVAANRLGWTTIQVSRQHGVYAGVRAEHPYQAHYHIRDLKELAVLKALKHLFTYRQTT